MAEIIQIYLAGGCFNEPDEGRIWRRTATEILSSINDFGSTKIIRVIDPIEYFSYSESKHQNDKQVKYFYYDQILHSRLLLVNMNRSSKSCGTCMECQFAADHQIPIIGFGTEDIYPWLKVDSQAIFPTMDEAIRYINDYYFL